MNKKNDKEEILNLIYKLTSMKNEFDKASVESKNRQKVIDEFELICKINPKLQNTIKDRYPNPVFSNDIFEMDFFSYSLYEIIEYLKSKLE